MALITRAERLAGAAGFARRRGRPIATGVVVIITTSLRLDVERCRVMPSRARAPTLLYCEAICDDEDASLNLDAEARRWANVVAPPSKRHPFDVVESFGNTPSRSAFEAARRAELLRRVFPDGAWETFEERCQTQSPYGRTPGWRLASFLVKADDELGGKASRCRSLITCEGPSTSMASTRG